MPSESPAVPFLWAMLLVGATLSGCLGTDLPTAEPGMSSGWSFRFAPDGMTGDLALFIEITTKEVVPCKANEEATGAFRDSRGGIGHFSFSFHNNSRFSGVAVEEMPSTHYQGVSPTEPLHTLARWGGTATFEGNVTPESPYRQFSVSLGVSDSTETPAFSLGISCAGPAELRLWATTEQIHPFAPHSMKGGLGASVVAHPDLPALRLNEGDRMERAIPEELVFFAAAISAAGDSHTEGTLYLQHPSGQTEWQLAPDEFEHASRRGGPGDYAVGLDMVSTDFHMPVYGALAGMDLIEPEALYGLTGTIPRDEGPDETRKG